MPPRLGGRAALRSARRRSQTPLPPPPG
jgi:hypothetical protein